MVCPFPVSSLGIRSSRARVAWMALLLLCPSAFSQGKSSDPNDGTAFDGKLRAAAAKYEARQYDEVDAILRELLPASRRFEVHELLGLSYAAQGRSSEAVEQLALAVQLRPGSTPAHTNLAAALIHAGKPEQAQDECRKALALDPHDYDANRDLAELYLVSNQIAQAVPFLEEAQRARPAAYDNSYDLALAYLLTNKLEPSRQQVDSLAQTKDSGELHTLRGRIDEAEGKFVEAANEYGVAAHMDPSEDTLFTWGSELLLHRTYEPAIAVFEQATSRYRTSSRLWIGLGMALYSRGEYEKSIHSLLAAADIDPKDPRCYLFLSKAYLSSPDQAEEVIARFRRYAELEPSNALAQYYYAVSLWKGRRTGDSTVDFHTVENLLQKSISLDGTIADAHLQLGILYNDEHAYERALPEYERALQLNPGFADAHYRLGQYYVHAGDKTLAQQEFDLFKKLQAEHQAQVDKERAEVQQFVVSTSTDHSAKP
jgi:tetratricopeptide (TPR) repeat protein